MRLVERQEVLESVFVEMDPLVEGFRGVLVELLEEIGRASCRERVFRAV